MKILKSILDEIVKHPREINSGNWWAVPILLFIFWGMVHFMNIESSGCPSGRFKTRVLPLQLSAKLIKKYKKNGSRSILTFVLRHNEKIDEIYCDNNWIGLETYAEVNDSIYKLSGSTDIILVKATGERKLYKYVCPE